MKADPFVVPSDEKIAHIARGHGGRAEGRRQYATLSFAFVREEKFFASSNGSRIEQTRVRCMPDGEVTVIDQATGRFASRASLAAPRGSGYDYILGHDFAGEFARRRSRRTKSSGAKSVTPGAYDLVLDPTNPLAHRPRVGRPSHRARSRACVGSQLRGHHVLHGRTSSASSSTAASS